MTNPYNLYEKNAIETLSKEDVLIKTYEEILSLLNITKMALEKGDIKTKAQNISKITNAITVLQASLDFEKGNEIAKNLNSLYDFILDELLKANIQNNIKHIDNIIDVLTPIYEGFVEAKKKLK